jgi:hypothetical protein
MDKIIKTSFSGKTVSSSSVHFQSGVAHNPRLPSIILPAIAAHWTDEHLLDQKRVA